ncbi:hypothetical protein CHS0354_036537 [Potamilus streckersoni]|uniref:G-protein coupled receptors family 1 profile domain-containing protein n=1 Tax=Potamilus streckersoni TaxID=2493646 RepID=A0AAE0WAS9_9BIVA|nr:hypothetical protein CHS0354_036537 [Potamilus streckersoni]
MSSGNVSSSGNCLGNTTMCWNGTSKVSNEDSSATTYFLSFTFIYIPGLVTNIFVLILILRDFRKAVFPAIILLLVLCCADFIALVVSFLQHTMNRYVLTITYSRCAVFAIIHPYFRMYAGFLNSFMAIDRVLALGTPFFYKSKIQVATWKIGSVIAAIVALIIGLFPVIGLGEVWIQRKVGNTNVSICSTFGYFPVPWKRAYGIVYGMMGFVSLLTIVVCNTLVIRIVLQLKNRITTLEQKSSNESSSKTSFEMAFAKLMGGLAVVYIICNTPYNVGSLHWLEI